MWWKGAPVRPPRPLGQAPLALIGTRAGTGEGVLLLPVVQRQDFQLGGGFISHLYSLVVVGGMLQTLPRLPISIAKLIFSGSEDCVLTLCP
jgi:hypothetical protein